MKAKKRQPKKKYKSIDLKQIIESSPKFRIKGEKNENDNADEESDEESPLTNMRITDIQPVSAVEGSIHFVLSMNYDYKAYKNKHGKELEKMQKSLIAIAKYDS